MKIFDFNIHLPVKSADHVDFVVENDMSLDEQGLIAGFEFHYSSFDEIEGANFLLFNTSLFENSINNFISRVSSNLEFFSFTALIDFRRPDITEYLENVKRLGGQMVMVNSYLQKIDESEFELLRKVFQYAEKLGLAVCIDGSYGTSKMFKYDNMKLICYISDFISKVPLIIIHGGSCRIIQSMLLALDKSNVYLDTSFAMPFFMGSSIEQDFAFAYKKIGADRILFGSDHPYQSFDESLLLHKTFFKNHNFSDQDLQLIYRDNAINLISRL